MKISRVMECLPDKLLKLRVHSNTDRITLHEIVKQVTFDLYTTFCFKDIVNDPSKELMKIYLEFKFPTAYLTEAKLPELLNATIGRFIKNDEEVELTVVLPATRGFFRKKKCHLVYIALDNKTWSYLKTCSTDIHLISYKMWMVPMNP